MKVQKIRFEDLGSMGYQTAWDYQEKLLKGNVEIKRRLNQVHQVGSSALAMVDENSVAMEQSTDILINEISDANFLSTTHHLLFVEHPPVYTLGKSGKEEHVLISTEERELRQIEFVKTNRGGDITFHGPEQLVGYPILDLEKFYTDIGRYLRNIEEVIIQTMAEYGLKGQRSAGETGVWLDPDIKGKERKICAIGVRCSRWVTMHGFAFNVNTDLSYFDHIVPCGIADKQVTSLEKELGRKTDMNEVKRVVRRKFEEVFGVLTEEARLISG